MLKPGAFPTLRGSLFCGEPLLSRHAQAWQEAAPNQAAPTVRRSFAQRGAGLDELGGDRERDLLDGLGADGQADGSADGVEPISRNAALFEFLEGERDFAAAADHADVTGRLAFRASIEDGGEGLGVVPVAARHDDAEGVRVHRRVGEATRDRSAHDAHCRREAFEQVGAIVEDRDVEIERGNEPRHGLTDVPRAGDQELLYKLL